METKPISMSGFSESGKKTLDNLSANPTMYSNFLKMQGRMFKFPTSVALEFFSHSEKIDCIATEGQWVNLGYKLKNSAEAVRFIDSKGTIHLFYDFSQIENAEYFPKRWEVTQENVAEVKNYLRSNYNISDGNPNSSIISMMLYCTNNCNDNRPYSLCYCSSQYSYVFSYAVHWKINSTANEFSFSRGFLSYKEQKKLSSPIVCLCRNQSAVLLFFRIQ